VILRFFLLQIKAATRSTAWQKNLALNLVIGFFLLLFAAYLLMLGLFIKQILNEVAPHKDHYILFNGLLLYYFIGDLLIRFLLQSLPVLTIESFLHLPVKKSSIINYMIGRTAFDVFNYLPLFILTPVIFTIVVPYIGGFHAIIWIVTLLLLIGSNNFLVIFFKRMLGVKPLIVAACAAAILALVILDRLTLISLSGISSAVFGFFPQHPLAVIIPVIWLIATFSMQYYFLFIHLYPDEVQKKKSEQVQDRAENQILKSMGLIGSIISVEFKLYLRNKRTKTMLYLCFTWLRFFFFMA
jgi:hypothetical protein